MVELQRTVIESNRELLTWSLSVQHRTLALSWGAFAPPHDGERTTDEPPANTDTASNHRGITHAATSAAGEGNAVQAVDEQLATGRRTSRTVDDDSTDRVTERSASTEGTARSAIGPPEEVTEPSTEVPEDPATSAGGGDEAVDDRRDNIEDGSEETAHTALQERVHGIGDAHAESLRDAGIESLTGLTAARADTVAESADVTTDRAADWIERAGAISTRDVDRVEGIGDAHAADLQEGGIETVPDLAGADTDAVAATAAVSREQAQAWIDDAQRRQEAGLRTVDGIGETRADRLRGVDIETVADLAAADADRVAAAADVSTERAQEWIRTVQA